MCASLTKSSSCKVCSAHSSSMPVTSNLASSLARVRVRVRVTVTVRVRVRV